MQGINLIEWEFSKSQSMIGKFRAIDTKIAITSLYCMITNSSSVHRFSLMIIYCCEMHFGSQALFIIRVYMSSSPTGEYWHTGSGDIQTDHSTESPPKINQITSVINLVINKNVTQWLFSISTAFIRIIIITIKKKFVNPHECISYVSALITWQWLAVKGS